MKFGSPNIPQDNVVPPDQGWGTLLLRLLKSVVDDLSVIFDRGIHFNEHVYGGIVTVPVVAGTYPVTFAVKTRKVEAVWIGKFVEKSSATAAPTAAVGCDWEFTSGSVAVSNITGLTAGAEYSITFVYLGG